MWHQDLWAWLVGEAERGWFAPGHDSWKEYPASNHVPDPVSEATRLPAEADISVYGL